MNSLNLTSLPWTGTYFGGVINSLRAIPLSEEEYTFDYWEMTTSTPNPSNKDSAITTEFVAGDVIIAHFKPPQSIFIPTGFSPNGDGLNDKLAIMGQGITSVSFAVYDRWGQRVFFTTDPEINWDGTFNGQLLNSGVFAYKMEAVLRDGAIINQTGNITLMR